jgi:ketosteroid isomerase-like protein
MFGLASPQQSHAAESARDDVRCIEIAFSRSVESRDQAFFASFLDDDTRFIGNAVTRGASGVVDAWAAFFTETGPQLWWRPYYVEVAASGDIAFSRGPYRARGKNEEGEVVDSWGIFNSVWRKTPGGQWKIIFDAGNPGENQVTGEMKELIDQPVENCDFKSIRKLQMAAG